MKHDSHSSETGTPAPDSLAATITQASLEGVDKIPADDLKWKMHGGLRLPHPDTVSTKVSVMPISARLAIPIEQPKIGAFHPVISVGDTVSKYQIIARSTPPHASCLHAPSSGILTGITSSAILHPSGLDVAHMIIETDGLDQAIDAPIPAPWQQDSFGSAQLCRLLNQHGVVGQGGGHYLSGRKMLDCHGKSNHILIINACECDPYIKCDHVLMLERASDIVEGIRALSSVMKFEQIILGIESDMPDALQALIGAGLEEVARIKVLPTIYPIGNEKQLIYAVCGKRIGLRDHPSDVGIVCLNVATIASIAKAILHAQPVIERLVTVAGAGIAQPQNVWARIGTPIADLIAHCGGINDDQYRHTIIGGKMTGFVIGHHDFHLLRSTNSVLFAGIDEDPEPPQAKACIQCNFCQEVCPAELQPQRMLTRILAGKYASADVDYHLFQCIECGCCDQVCPSHIPLTGYFRYAKGAMRAQTVSMRLKREHDHDNARHLERISRQGRQRAEALQQSHSTLDNSPKARADIIARALKNNQPQP